jgi:hypothetical protein
VAVKLLLALIPLTLSAQSVISVCAGCSVTSLSAAVDAAIVAQNNFCGPVVLEFAAGEVFPSGKVLPIRSCRANIALRGSRNAALPQDRVTPANASSMPIIRPLGTDPTNWALSIVGSNYTIEGILIETVDGAPLNYRLVEVGTLGQTSAFPENVIFDRVIMRGRPSQNGPGRAISIEACTNCEVRRSYIYECKTIGADAQAVLCIQCVRLRLINNHLEGAGENVMAGGGGGSGNSDIHTPGLAQFVSAVGNFMPKNPEWLVRRGVGAPTGTCLVSSYYQNTSTGAWHQCAANGATGAWGGPGSPAQAPLDVVVKNGWEQKDSGAFLRGNIVARVPRKGQAGYGVLLNQTGNAPNYQTHLTAEFNQFLDVNNGISIGRLQAQRAGTVRIRHNNWRISPYWARTDPPDSTALPFSNTARMISLERVEDFEARNNTWVLSTDGGYAHSVISPVHDNYSTPPGWRRVVFEANIFPGVDYQTAPLDQSYGATISGSGGLSSVCDLASTVIEAGGFIAIRNNAFVRADTRLNASDSCPGAHRVPAGNLLPSSIDTVLTAPAATTPDYSVKVGYAARGAGVDGGDLGANQSAVSAMTATTESGVNNAWHNVRVQAGRVIGTTAYIRYTRLSTASTCTVEVSEVENFTPKGTLTQTLVGLTVEATIAGASGARWSRITCDGTSLPPERI